MASAPIVNWSLFIFCILFESMKGKRQTLIRIKYILTILHDFWSRRSLTLLYGFKIMKNGQNRLYPILRDARYKWFKLSKIWLECISWLITVALFVTLSLPLSQFGTQKKHVQSLINDRLSKIASDKGL